MFERWRWLPKKPGSGGTDVQEPTLEDVKCFLEHYEMVPLWPYKGQHHPYSPDYGTQYSCIIVVRQWLELLVEAKLLKSNGRTAK